VVAARSRQLSSDDAWQHLLEDLLRLTRRGVCGIYDRFEVTELVGFPSEGPPVNILSVLVAEEGEVPDAEVKLSRLNPGNRISLPNLREWSFGAFRYAVPLEAVSAAIHRYCSAGSWELSGKQLVVGALSPLDSVFVPANGSEGVALNRILRNNFWSGSHVLELFDPDKAKVDVLLREPRHLQALSAAIAPFLPIGIDGLSDRLGNVVIQIPTTSIVVDVSSPSRADGFQLEVAWHPAVTPRPLQAMLQTIRDGLLSGFTLQPVVEGIANLPVRSWRDPHRVVVWDPENGVTMAATAPTSFTEGVTIDMAIADRRLRRFREAGTSMGAGETAVTVADAITPVEVGEYRTSDRRDLQDRRIYLEEIARVQEGREFVQYGLPGPTHAGEHQRALEDLEYLLRQHGRTAAWLWDPYLNSNDLLATLFRCPWSNSDLRALTEGREPPCRRSEPPTRQEARAKATVSTHAETWRQAQKTLLDASSLDPRGLRLEFRSSHGQKGWGFHDRFLIFPQRGSRARAWSLGSSVNSLGLRHHILQEVPDGQRIADAFTTLWEALDEPEHVIWKAP
jgi:hypothetical protein